MTAFRSFLLALLCITLPLQAALAAVGGGCLHQAAAGRTSAGTSAGTSADTRDAVALQQRTEAQFWAQRLQHPAPAVQAAAADPDSGCAHHAAEARTPSHPGSDADCHSCGLCCLGTALFSAAQRWQARAAQQTPALLPAHTRPSPPLRLLERPPRAEPPLFTA